MAETDTARIDTARIDEIDHGRRNLWATSLASFLTDISSEMVVHLLPLYLAGALGLKTAWIGLIEGMAKTVASLVKIGSGWLSDRLRGRKWLAVAGYALSTLAKPFYAVAETGSGIAAVRWSERVGKGVRTAPRDALLADSAAKSRRGLVFGLHRAADTLGAVVGLGVAIIAVLALQGDVARLDGETFRQLVWWSLVPAVVAVVVLALMAREVPPPPKGLGQATTDGETDGDGEKGLGRAFWGFLAVLGLFELGNSADAFLVLRAAERGAAVPTVLGMLLVFNLVYAFSSAPGGWLSDRWGRRRVLAAGWLLYAGVYLGFALTHGAETLWLFFGLYGLYYGLTLGTAKALVADVVPASQRGLAYGWLAATLGLFDLPASVIAGVLWQGLFDWPGFGPSAPFLFGAVMAVVAAIILLSFGRFFGISVTAAAGRQGAPGVQNRPDSPNF